MKLYERNGLAFSIQFISARLSERMWKVGVGVVETSRNQSMNESIKSGFSYAMQTKK